MKQGNETSIIGICFKLTSNIYGIRAIARRNTLNGSATKDPYYLGVENSRP
jgi:hypothetical protein